MKMSFSVCLFPQYIINNLHFHSNYGLLIVLLYTFKFYQHTARNLYNSCAFSVHQNCSCFLPLSASIYTPNLYYVDVYSINYTVTAFTGHWTLSKFEERHSLLFLLNDYSFWPLSVFLLSPHKGVFCTGFYGLRLCQLALSSHGFSF